MGVDTGKKLTGTLADGAVKAVQAESVEELLVREDRLPVLVQDEDDVGHGV
jgi:hypothetical protein